MRQTLREIQNQGKLRENQRGLFMGNVISKIFGSCIYKLTKVVVFCLKVAYEVKISWKIT